MIKKILAALAAFAMLINLPGCQIRTEKPDVPYTVKDDVKIYSEDYAEKYVDTLYAMFGEDCTISNAGEYSFTPEYCDCGKLDFREEKYNQWSISYTDGDNLKRRFTLKNNETLSSQIETYLENMVSDYFEKNFLAEYTEELPLNKGGNYIFCFMVNMSVDRDEVPEKCKKIEEYHKKIEQPEHCINFSKLKMKNIFKECPLYLSIQFSVSGNEDKAWKQAQDMMTEIMDFTNNTVNAKLSVYCHDDVREAYINGKKSDFGIYYERDVYDAYEGIFW